MSLLVGQPTIALEEIQRQAFYVLYDNLNDAITEVAAARATFDQEFATRTGRDFTEIVLEEVASANFHEGHIPSLIKAPLDGYPNVAVMATQAIPQAESIDQGSAWRDSLFVDVMVKSESSEDEVNKRVHRMAEAAHLCLIKNQTLNGLVEGFQGDPSLIMGDVFTRKERSAYGPVWFWQGARLEYAVRKSAALPSNSGSTFQAVFGDFDQG